MKASDDIRFDLFGGGAAGFTARAGPRLDRALQMHPNIGIQRHLCRRMFPNEVSGGRLCVCGLVYAYYVGANGYGRSQGMALPARCGVCVDDLQAMALGSATFAARALSAAYVALAEAAEKDSLPFSDSKTQVLVSTAPVRKAVCDRHPEPRSKDVASANNLGPDFRLNRRWAAATRNAQRALEEHQRAICESANGQAQRRYQAPACGTRPERC